MSKEFVSKNQLEVQDIFRSLGKSFYEKLDVAKRRVFNAIVRCRTAQLGIHFTHCTKCSYRDFSYNSCRNRHCPKCQGATAARWVDARKEELLPVPYAHTVFTLPKELRSICYQNKRVVYEIFFKAVSETLNAVAANPKFLGAKLSFYATLHTWNQKLEYHPHLHVVSQKGGLSFDGTTWIPCKTNFFLPVRALSKVFRGKMLELLQNAHRNGKLSFYGSSSHLSSFEAFNELLQTSKKSNWVVYSKKPFGGPEQVIKYLSAYVQRVAISNYRLRKLQDNCVTFSYRDSRNNNKKRLCRLSTEEFARRFLLHILPKAFVRTRHYGLFSTATKRQNLRLARQLLGEQTSNLTVKIKPFPPAEVCPKCLEATLIHEPSMKSHRASRSYHSYAQIYVLTHDAIAPPHSNRSAIAA